MEPDTDSWHGDAPDKARFVAEKTLQRLRDLQAQFPSADLAEAIKHLEAWHEKYLRGEA